MDLGVDESTGVVVARRLRSLGHDVLSIREDHPRMLDDDILALAVREDRVLITNDKDVGELAFRDRRPHRGIVLLRLAHDDAASKIAALQRFLAEVPDDLASCFVVLTDRGIRVTRTNA